MKKPNAIRSVVWLSILLSAIAQASDSEDRGSISGIVVDQLGNPVTNAHVTTRDLDLPPNTVEVGGGVVPYAETDVQGRFLFKGLKVGHRYKVYSEKEEDGYPDMMLGMYNPTDTASIATATSSVSTERVIIHLGPKAARLKWNVKDAVSGDSIETPTFSFERRDSGASAGGTALADEGVLVPSNTDLIVEISARRYRDWYYGEALDKSTAASLRLVPGEEKTLQVQLQPVTK
jgi:hypothetical protein